MNSIVDFLHELRAKSINVSASGNELHCEAPPGTLTPELRERMRANKPAILRLLSNARLQADLARYGSELDLIVLPVANPSHVQPTDFSHARELLDAAYRAVSQMLDDSRTLSLRGDHDDSLDDDDRADVRWLGRLSERWPPARTLPRNRRAVAGAALSEQARERPQLSAAAAEPQTPFSDPSHPPG